MLLLQKKLEAAANPEYQLHVSLLTRSSTSVCFVFKGSYVHCHVYRLRSQIKTTFYFPTGYSWLCKEFPFSFHLTVVPNDLKIKMANLTPATSFWNKSHPQHAESQLHQRHVCLAHLHAAFSNTTYFSSW